MKAVWLSLMMSSIAVTGCAEAQTISRNDEPASLDVRPVPQIAQFVGKKDCEECPDMVTLEVNLAGKTSKLSVAATELTWKQYLKTRHEHTCPMPVVQPKYNSRFEWKNLEDDYPLTSIRASQIECYLGWIRNKTGLQYRLPSEEEWVAIARSETGREVYRVAQASRQEGYLKNRLVFSDEVSNDPRKPVRFRALRKVAQYKPTPSGLYDLFGNAKELVCRTEHRGVSRTSTCPTSPLATVKGGNVGSPDTFDLINDASQTNGESEEQLVGFRLVYTR
ncbi:MAG: SUMF1/EgtB/PvdO family nonheme iron enzyme [Parasphingorhabdus sp.]